MNVPVDLRDKPYIGIGLYGLDEECLRAGRMFEIACSINGILDTWKLNTVTMFPVDKQKLSWSRSSVTRRIRRGESWQRVAEVYRETKVRSMGFSSSPSSDYAYIEYCFLDYSNARRLSGGFIPSSVFFGGSWVDTHPLLLVDFREFFSQFYNAVNDIVPFLSGSIHLYPTFNYQELLPVAISEPNGGERTFRPIHFRCSSKSVGESSSDEVGMIWCGKPFGLYWGNILHRDIADRWNVKKFLLTETDLVWERLDDGIPARPCVGWLLDEFLFFCLSADISDSLAPDDRYRQRYEKILGYFLETGLIWGAAT